MKITGNVTVFKNDKGFYSIGVSNKNMDGTYENAYITAQFKKGVDLENKTKIDITNAFLSFYRNQEGKPVFKIVVLEFTQYGDVKEEESAPYADNNTLPF